MLQKTVDKYEHRASISGVPHCPECGGMLWPPAYTGPVVTEDGEKLESVTDCDPDDVCLHEKCFEARNNGEPYKPKIPSENSERRVEFEP